MKLKSFFVIAAAGLLCGTVSGASAAVLRLSCDDYSNSDASMWVRFIDSGERQTFDVIMKMPITGNNLQAPDRSVLIGVQNIGQITLTPNDEGMMSGSLSYDSYAGSGEASPQVFPFPGDWTGAISGNLVRAAGLSCELKD